MKALHHSPCGKPSSFPVDRGIVPVLHLLDDWLRPSSPSSIQPIHPNQPTNILLESTTIMASPCPPSFIIDTVNFHSPAFQSSSSLSVSCVPSAFFSIGVPIAIALTGLLAVVAVREALLATAKARELCMFVLCMILAELVAAISLYIQQGFYEGLAISLIPLTAISSSCYAAIWQVLIDPVYAVRKESTAIISHRLILFQVATTGFGIVAGIVLASVCRNDLVFNYALAAFYITIQVYLYIILPILIFHCRNLVELIDVHFCYYNMPFGGCMLGF